MTPPDSLLPMLRRLASTLALCSAGFAQSNLLTNGDAETGTLAGWVDPIANGFNVSSTTMHSGAFSFTGGVTGPSAGAHNNELRQDVSVAALANEIDAGAITSSFRGCGRSNAAGGFVDPGRVQLEFRGAGGAVLATYSPGTFQPYNAWQTFADVRTVPAGTRTLRVRLLGSRPIGGSTDCFFDDLELGVYQWQAVGTGCAGGNGVPTLALTAPPWLGDNFTLSAANLAGGVTFMLTGLTSANVPLQPLGLGFGAGCTQLAAADAVQFVPQNAGGLTWSIGLPNDPAFTGLNLWNQVVELSATSTVSNAGHAVLR